MWWLLLVPLAFWLGRYSRGQEVERLVRSQRTLRERLRRRNRRRKETQERLRHLRPVA